MTTKSIVLQLADWVAKNAQMLTARGVKITKNFPEPESAHPWKASIGLTYDGVIVSYTVWERTRLQTELLVMNAHTGKTVAMEEGEPTDPSVVSTDMNGAVEKLLDGTYRRMNPDPRLTIS